MPKQWLRNTIKSGSLLLSAVLFLGATAPCPTFAADGNLPPYEQSLRRLTSIVGALMYLDPLCNNSNSQDWYEQMRTLMETEDADETRRRQLIDRFNRSYRNYASTYKSCNKQARMVTELYHSEGQALLTYLKLKHAR